MVDPGVGQHDAASGVVGAARGVAGLGEVASEAVVVANEFAEVIVRRVGTGNGVRLEVRSPRLGRIVLLDPLQLECLTWQQPALYSELLCEPFGPDADGQSYRADEGGAR